jgi:3-dehydroquinate dehydratase/shikimate dehydrogenase
LQLAQASKFPVIPIAMGEIGIFTRVLGAKFGAPFTYAGFNPERIFAAGMLRYPVLRKDYRYNQIDAQTEVYGVIGDPIEQSLSPAIHNAAFRQAVIPFLKTKEEAVEHTGACNTLIFNEDGTLSGYNTDYQAAIDTLEQGMAGGEIPGDSPSPLVDKQVLILGAGGAARSLAFGVAHRGGKVSITNRNDEKAETLAEQVGCRKVAWSQRATVIADVIVNCTPVGMHPQVDDAPLPPAAFGRSGIVVFDTVYHPEHTMLLKLARERQAIGISGVEMFLRQAALQFKRYTGQEAPLDVMRETLKRKLGPLRDD